MDYGNGKNINCLRTRVFENGRITDYISNGTDTEPLFFQNGDFHSTNGRKNLFSVSSLPFEKTNCIIKVWASPYTDGMNSINLW